MFKVKSMRFHLFINTCIIFFILILIQFIAQLIFLQSFNTYFNVLSVKDDFTHLFTKLESASSKKETSNYLNEFSIQTNSNNYILNYSNPIVNSDDLITIQVETEHGKVTLYTIPDEQYDFSINSEITFQGLKHTTNNVYLSTMISKELSTYGKVIYNYSNSVIKQHLTSSKFDNFNFNFLYEITGKILSVKEPDQSISLEDKLVLQELTHMPNAFQDKSNFKELKFNDTVNGTYYTNQNDTNKQLIILTDVSINNEIYNLITIISLNPTKVVANALIFFNILFGIFLLLFSFLLAYIYTKKATKPIHDLIHFTTEKVYDGVDEEISLDENQEVVQLSTHFNKLYNKTLQAKKQSDYQQIKLIEL